MNKQPAETAGLKFPTDLILDMVLGYGCILLAGSFVKAVFKSLQPKRQKQSSSRQDLPNQRLLDKFPNQQPSPARSTERNLNEQ